MASSRFSLIALGAGAYVAFAAATFPASIAARWFAPDNIALAGVEGTVWRGSAAYGGIPGLAMSDVRWQLQPAALLTGRLSLTLEARLDDGLVRTGITVAGSRLSFTELRAGLNLASLQALLPVDEAYGNASIELDILELVDGWPVQASGTVRVVDLVSSPWIPVPGVTTLRFGSFLARLSTADETVVAVVADEGGPLELEGSARLTPDRRYRVEARVKPRADAAPAMVQGLKIMATAGASGYHMLELEGAL